MPKQKKQLKIIKSKVGEDLSYISPDLRPLAGPIKQFKLDPRNPRRGEVEVVAVSLQEHGQQKTITVYQFPGDGFFTIITGNHTTKAALSLGWENIAASEYLGPPEKAKAFALVDNRSSDLADYDDNVLVELLSQAKDSGKLETTGYSKEDLEYLSTVLRQEEEKEENDDFKPIDASLKEGEDDPLTETDYNVTALYSKDTKFSSSNRWGLPDYIPEMFAEPPDDGLRTWADDYTLNPEDWEGYWFLVWGHNAKTIPLKKTILGFYTSDKQLETLWKAPARYARNISSSELYAVTSPDFSMYEDAPFAERLWNLYRERWMGRYFQESGIYLIPSLTGGVSKIGNDLTFMNLPKRIPCISMNFQTNLKRDKKSELYCRKTISGMLKRITPDCVIVYGGRVGHELTDRMFPASLQVLRIPSISIIRDMYRLENKEYTPDPIRGDVKKGNIKGKRRKLHERKNKKPSRQSS